ncbi:UbiA prenyltransferase family-domain-containing protein [Melampsora americana]|nr:UbiA prenyltransferase family-domain-containing protein [Melampsora americana]
MLRICRTFSVFKPFLRIRLKSNSNPNLLKFHFNSTLPDYKSNQNRINNAEEKAQTRNLSLTYRQTIKNQFNRSKQSIKPYLAISRIQSPMGSILLFLPCATSITLASTSILLPPSQLIYQLGIFGLGAFVMRGAGCTINDLWDQKIDSKVKRTENRPLPSGSITIPKAITWLGLQLSVGLAVLLQLNTYSILLGSCSLFLVVIYPLMKRITYWPQLVLGLAFNWGALLGSSAILGETNWQVALPLYFGHVAWTIIYDTIYAHQDKEFDVKVGVKSTAILFNKDTKMILSGFSVSMISLIGLSGYLNQVGIWYYLISCFASSLHLFNLIYKLDIYNPISCLKAFNLSTLTGFLIFFGCLVDYGVKYLSKEEVQEILKVTEA